MSSDPRQPLFGSPAFFSQHPSSSPPSVASKRRWDQRLRSWYRSQSKNAQAGIGCVVLLGMLCLCSMCGIALNAAGSGNTPSDASTDTPTPTTDTRAIVVSPTDTPTAIPTPSPTRQPTPKPPPTSQPAPTHAPAPLVTPTPSCQAVNNNPWCYNFSPGNFIYSPPGSFCNYFACINNFWNGTGYVNECADGMYSKSGGHRGDCSYHGGELRPLYSH